MRNSYVFSVEELDAIRNSANPNIQTLLTETLRRIPSNAAASHFIPFADSNTALLAFAYYMTGDITYFNRALTFMRSTAAEEQWWSDEYDPAAYEGYDIRTALETHDRCNRMSEGLALFGDLLDPAEFDTLVRATYEKGILPILEDWVLPGTRIHALDTMGHNFWITTVSGAATALTLLYDAIPDADVLLKAAKEAIVAWFTYRGNPLNVKPATIDNGGYYESVTYFDYSLHEYLRFATVYKRRFGESPFDDTELLMKAADFLLNVRYSSSEGEQFVPFGDTSGDGFLFAPVCMLRYGLEHPGLRRYVRQLKSGDALLRLLVLSDIEGKPNAEPTALASCYDGIGWAMFKSTHEPDGDMLCVKCGDTWNHAHADAGHFTLFRRGNSEIHDSGVSNYSSPNYIPYFADSHGHNVLLFEGKGQDFRDNYKNHAHLPGKLYNFRDGDGFRMVTADTTGPMSRYFRKHHRHFLWLDGFILIYDDVECYETGTVNYLLHAEEQNCHRMLTKCEITVENGFSVRNPGRTEEPCTYQSFNRSTDAEGHVRFASLLLLDEALSYTFDEDTPDWRLDIGEYTVYFNHRADGKVMHRNGIVKMGGYITDALILVMKKNTPFAVVNGSIVRPETGGESALESLYRVTGRI